MKLRIFRPFINTANILLSLAAQAAFGFSGHRLKIIGVTGTTGKTVTAHYIASVLESDGRQVGVVSRANIRSNKQTEVAAEDVTSNPFRLHRQLYLMRKQGVDWVVMEVTSQCLKHKRIWGLPIRLAVMTNLSSSHLVAGEAVEDYAATKAKLLRMVQKAVVLNRDDEWYEYFLKTPKQAVYDYGAGEDASVRIDRHKFKSDRSHLRIRFGERVVNATLSLPGETMSYCALAAATAAYGLDVSWQNMREGLESVKNVPGRMEIVREGQPFAMIVDYARTPGAFAETLEDMKSVEGGNVTAVLPEKSDTEYAEIARAESVEVLEEAGGESGLDSMLDSIKSQDKLVVLGDRASSLLEVINDAIGRSGDHSR